MCDSAATRPNGVATRLAWLRPNFELVANTNFVFILLQPLLVTCVNGRSVSGESRFLARCVELKHLSESLSPAVTSCDVMWRHYRSPMRTLGSCSERPHWSERPPCSDVTWRHGSSRLAPRLPPLSTLCEPNPILLLTRQCIWYTTLVCILSLSKVIATHRHLPKSYTFHKRWKLQRILMRFLNDKHVLMFGKVVFWLW